MLTALLGSGFILAAATSNGHATCEHKKLPSTVAHEEEGGRQAAAPLPDYFLQKDLQVLESRQLEDGGDAPRAISEINFIPQKNVVLCACDKCGTTSLYEFVYKALFGRKWNYEGAPWVQQPSNRWENQLESLDTGRASFLMGMESVFSLAIVRDPRKRLISSWKSKVACDTNCWQTDLGDRNRLVPELLRLAGNTSQADCLSFEDFVHTLFTIHSQGKAGQLDGHFLPQNLGCFRDFPRERWSKVADIVDPSAPRELSAHLGMAGDVASYGQVHKSKSKCYELVASGATAHELDVITQAEYRAIGRS
eukprot:TRINITY_DN29820_c0_g1_i1.p1 TRINITY_DN29820_c0_g1~~TRINITY_DN29820_c0_g1_i1.p1  ORF type:complete len:308 (+),score=56.21 TRINITY_DN29820_c0_g1_i1:86-1009(+)